MINSTCPICGRNTKPSVHPKTKIIYHHCSYCGYIQKDISAIPSPEAAVKKYLEHHNSLDNADYVSYLKAFIDQALWLFIGKNNPEGLDYGCGYEPVLKAILERDYHALVTAYDPYFHDHRGYLDKRYDFIVSTEVFEHLSDPLADLRRLAGLLRDGGVIAIMTLFHPDDPNTFNDWWYIRDVTHIGFFRPETFKVMAKLVQLDYIITNSQRYVTLGMGFRN